MKIFGVSLLTIVLIVAAYYLGTKGILSKATSAVGA